MSGRGASSTAGWVSLGYTSPGQPCKESHVVKPVTASMRTLVDQRRRTEARTVGIVIALATCCAGLARAQEPRPTEGARDTLRVYDLGEIVISAVPDAIPVEVPHTLARVRVDEIEQRDAISVADVATLIPAAHVQTNSRGETLIYLRDAGERQVAVFFDGALLNIPWDNRVDVSLIPANAVGDISVAKGVPPVEYGANVLGGAVNLLSPQGALTELSGTFGAQGRVQGSATHRGRMGKVSYVGSVAHADRDGIALPSGADLPFSQPDDDVRTNTDSRVTNLLARAMYDFGAGTELAVALLHMDAEKGVAPESHLDPAVSRVRFWRYPEWRNTVGIVSGEGWLGAQARWKASAWVNIFGQTIDSYESALYQRVEDREEDDDLTLGSRVVFRRGLGEGAIKAAVNALTSTHKQRDLALDASGNPLPGETFPRLTYRQHLLSTGLQYELPPLGAVDLTVGGSVDAMFTPKTGDKPESDPLVDYSVTVGAMVDLRDGWFLRASAGRKTRFPTMRELFGEAIDRFVLNPDLGPESSILTEVGLGVRTPSLSGEIIPFGSFTSNTIDQQSVTVAGEARPRRERINLEGSRVLGLELVGAARPVPSLDVEAHLALMNVRRLTESPDEPTKLSEKPAVLGRLSTGYRGPQGTSALLETVYTGRAYSLNDDNQFVPLNTSLVLNLRLAQRFSIAPSEALEVFLRVDNVTDEVVTPQLGLPAAGRTIYGGVKATL